MLEGCSASTKKDIGKKIENEDKEQKQAAAAEENGYVIYLPVDEWQQTDSSLWAAAVNEQVMLWVEHFEGESIEAIDQELEDKGYLTEKNHDKRKQEGDMIYHAGLKAFDNDVWGIFYCYPADSEEGWGRELPVIADTFAVQNTKGFWHSSKAAGRPDGFPLPASGLLRTLQLMQSTGLNCYLLTDLWKVYD